MKKQISFILLILFCTSCRSLSGRKGFTWLKNFQDRDFSEKYGSEVPKGSTYSQAVTHNAHKNSCPAIPEFSAKLDKHFEGETCGNRGALPTFNQAVLTEASQIPAGGGYKWQGAGAHPTNQNIDVCGKRVVNGGPSSHCSGSAFTVIVKAYERMGMFKELGICETYDQNQLRQKLGLGSKLFSTANNDGTQWGDVMSKYGLGRVALKEPSAQNIENASCPGDPISFSRRMGGKIYGHQGVYLGTRDGLVYWWGANKATDGWGVDCWPASKFMSGDFAVSRFEKPQNIVNVFPGHQIPAGFDDKALMVDSNKQGSESPSSAFDTNLHQRPI